MFRLPQSQRANNCRSKAGDIRTSVESAAVGPIPCKSVRERRRDPSPRTNRGLFKDLSDHCTTDLACFSAALIFGRALLIYNCYCLPQALFSFISFLYLARRRTIKNGQRLSILRFPIFACSQRSLQFHYRGPPERLRYIEYTSSSQFNAIIQAILVFAYFYGLVKIDFLAVVLGTTDVL